MPIFKFTGPEDKVAKFQENTPLSDRTARTGAATFKSFLISPKGEALKLRVLFIEDGKQEQRFTLPPITNRVSIYVGRLAKYTSQKTNVGFFGGGSGRFVFEQVIEEYRMHLEQKIRTARFIPADFYTWDLERKQAWGFSIYTTCEEAQRELKELVALAYKIDMIKRYALGWSGDSAVQIVSSPLLVLSFAEEFRTISSAAGLVQVCSEGEKYNVSFCQFSTDSLVSIQPGEIVAGIQARVQFVR